MWSEDLEPAPVDLEAAARALAGHDHVCWLDGSAGFHESGRHSYLACDPVKTLVARRDLAEVWRALELERASAGQCSPELAHLPRWAGYVAYDATWLRHDVGSPQHARADQPSLWLARYDAWLVLDHATGRARIVGDDQEAARRFKHTLSLQPSHVHARVGDLCRSDPTAHRAAITRALEAIERGDLYQVNLARQFTASIEGDALALYLAMRARGAVPLGMYLDAGDHQVLSRSMETFLRWDRLTRTLVTRPIKGTIARDGRDDARAALTLASDDKERAEHTMIVDLMRNDLSRLAELGSVRPTNVMRVEPYAGLSHLVSTVRCTTRADVGLEAVFDATFPPGSVTGTPKLSAIAHIEALEACPRGIYTGAHGYLDHAGGCHFAVTIRTAVVRDGRAAYFAGGGIVESSDPTRELAETELKAAVFLDAVAQLQALENDL